MKYTKTSYDRAYMEFVTGRYDKELFEKAMQESNGDPHAAKWRYIEFRLALINGNAPSNQKRKSLLWSIAILMILLTVCLGYWGNIRS